MDLSSRESSMHALRGAGGKVRGSGGCLQGGLRRRQSGEGDAVTRRGVGCSTVGGVRLDGRERRAGTGGYRMAIECT